MSAGNFLVRTCSAGVSPAVFPTPGCAKKPAGRRRYENIAFLWKLDKFHFATRIRRQRRSVGSLLVCVFALLFMMLTGACGKRGGGKIVVGSKNFTEQIVLAE